MKKFSGVIRMLGNAKVRQNARSYSVIEIGDDELVNVQVFDYIDNYLVRALESGSPVDLYIARKNGFMPYLMAIRLDGRLYKNHEGGGMLLALFMIVASIPFLILVIGIVPLWLGIANAKAAADLSSLE